MTAFPLGKNCSGGGRRDTGRGLVQGVGSTTGQEVVFFCFVSSHSNGIDVAGVSREGLLAGAFPHVPQLGQGVAGSRDEGVHVGGQSQGHAVSNVVGEDHLLLAGLQVPQAAGGTRGRVRSEKTGNLASGLGLGLGERELTDGLMQSLTKIVSSCCNCI